MAPARALGTIWNASTSSCRNSDLVVLAQTSPRAKNNLREFGPMVGRIMDFRAFFWVEIVFALLLMALLFWRGEVFCARSCFFVFVYSCASLSVFDFMCMILGGGPARRVNPRDASPDLHAKLTSKPRLTEARLRELAQPNPALKWTAHTIFPLIHNTELDVIPICT